MKEAIKRIYFLLRLPVLVVLKLFFPVVKDRPQKFTNILLIRLDRLGDFITSLPVIDNLALAYPDATIQVLVRPYLKELAEMIPNIDRAIVYEGFLKTAQVLRRSRFDLVIDLLLDYKLKTAVLAFLSAAALRLGFAWGYRQLLFTDFVDPRPLEKESMVAMHLALIEKIGVPLEVRIPRLAIERTQGSGSAYIAMHPGGNFPSQRWAKDRFAVLARRLAQRYSCDIAVIGTAKEQELVDFIVSRSQDARVRAVFPGMTELARLLSQCRVLVCNNSGPLHLAAALGVPTVSTMGPTVPQLWWPQGELHIVIRKDLACSPCSKATCRSHACMDLISVEEMEKAVSVLMDKVKARG